MRSCRHVFTEVVEGQSKSLGLVKHTVYQYTVSTVTLLNIRVSRPLKPATVGLKPSTLAAPPAPNNYIPCWS